MSSIDDFILEYVCEHPKEAVFSEAREAIDELLNESELYNLERIESLRDRLDSNSMFINNISDILVGYREGPEKQLIDRAIELVEINKKYNQNENTEMIFDAIRQLNDLVSDIEETQ